MVQKFSRYLGNVGRLDSYQDKTLIERLSLTTLEGDMALRCL